MSEADGAAWTKGGDVLHRDGKVLLCNRCPCCMAMLQISTDCLHVYGEEEYLFIQYSSGCVDGSMTKLVITSSVNIYSDAGCTELICGPTTEYWVPHSGYEVHPVPYLDYLKIIPIYTAPTATAGSYVIDLMTWDSSDQLVIIDQVGMQVDTSVMMIGRTNPTISTCAGEAISDSWSITGVHCSHSLDRYPGVSIETIAEGNPVVFVSASIPVEVEGPVGGWGPFTVQTPGNMTVQYTSMGVDAAVLGYMNIVPEYTGYASSIELVMYTEGDLFTLAFDCIGDFDISKVQLVSGDISDFEYYPDSALIDFSDPDMWAQDGGTVYWSHQIRPIDSITPGVFTLTFRYGSDGPLITGTINVTTGAVTASSDPLHIYGYPGLLRISVNGISGDYFNTDYVGVVAKVNGTVVSLYDYLRTAYNAALNFGEGWSVYDTHAVWETYVNAVASSAATVSLEITYGKMEVKTLNISLADDVTGLITITPTWIRKSVGEYAELEAKVVSGAGEPLPRVPTAARSITADYTMPIGGSSSNPPTVQYGAGGWGVDDSAYYPDNPVSLNMNHYIREITGNLLGIIEATLTVTPPGKSPLTFTAELEIRSDDPQLVVHKAPSNLHRYGEGSLLSIEVDTAGIEQSPLGTALDDVFLEIDFEWEDEDGVVTAGLGGSLEFFEGGVWKSLSMAGLYWNEEDSKWLWSYQVRASTGTEAEISKIMMRLYYYNQAFTLVYTSEMISIHIDRDIQASIDAPARAQSGSDFTVKASVTGPSGEYLSRLSDVAFTDGPVESIVAEFNGTCEGAIHSGGMVCTGSVDELCVYRFRLALGAHELAVADVTIHPAGPANLSSLVAAINERLANAGEPTISSGPYYYEDRLYLEQAIGRAIFPYGGGTILPGYVVSPGNWAQEFVDYYYPIVCDAYTAYDFISSFTSTYTGRGKSGSAPPPYNPNYSTYAEARMRTEADFNSRGWSSASYTGSWNIIYKSSTYNEPPWGYYGSMGQYGRMDIFTATIKADYIGVTTVPITVAGTWRSTVISTPSGYTYYTFGRRVPGTSSESMTLKIPAGASEAVRTAGSPEPPPMYSTRRGYSKVVWTRTSNGATFQFRHRS